MQTIYCRWSPSLGALEDTAQNVWGTPEYDPLKDRDEPCVFFGMYSARDYEVLFKHRGKRYVLWAGSDIKNFESGLAFGDGTLIELSKRFQGVNWILSRWINENCQNWCENDVEQDALSRMGIASIVQQSYLGKLPYKTEYEQNIYPNIYLSASEDRQEEYGWGLIEEIANQCGATFHLYGATWETKHHNIIVHGRVPKEQMNNEIRKMQCGMRLNEFDGFSEITAKSILWGQWPIVRKSFGYKHIEFN